MELLSDRLNRPRYFVEAEIATSHPLSNQSDCLFSTHNFSYLADMNCYEDPLLIRCTRRNRVDQYLSELMILWMGETVHKHLSGSERVYNIHPDTPHTFTDEFGLVEPTVITKNQLLNVHRMYMNSQRLWEEHSGAYRNITLYYEDLCEGVDIPELGLTNCILSDTRVVKLPDYKQRVFLNYDMIIKWTKELLSN